MQVAAILFGALFTVATATALGTLLLGKACGDWPVRFVLGAAALSFLVFLLAAGGLVYPAAFAVLGATAILACRPWDRWRDRGMARHLPRASAINILLFVIFIAYFYIYFLRALAPEVSPDGSTYHLSLTARYLREHGFHPIRTLYASLSQGMEMLLLFAFAFGKHSAAALVHLAFLVALVWQMSIWGVRHGMAWVGVCGAALVGLSPVVGVDGSSAYNDVALAAVAFTLFCLLERWAEEGTARLLPMIGIVAGFGYALKYTGWVGVAYAVGFVAWKSGRMRRWPRRPFAFCWWHPGCSRNCVDAQSAGAILQSLLSIHM